MKGHRFANAQESLFQDWKLSYKASAILLGGRFADVWNCVFKLRNVQIWAVPVCKGSICCFSGMAFSGCVIFRYEQCILQKGKFANAQESCFLL